MQNFNELNIDEALLKALKSNDFTTPTPIQAQALPAILEHNDVLGQAKTGSGKTLAFALGLLSQIDTTRQTLQAMVITPTRELALQVSTVIQQLSANMPNTKLATLYGGVKLAPQAKAIENGVHIIVGTPGRLEDLITKGMLDLSFIKILVLDEADRMLDMGFLEAIEKIVKRTANERQTLLFSATYDEEIEKITDNFLTNPVRIQTDIKISKDSIQEYAVVVRDRTLAVLDVLAHFQPRNVLIFCNTKQQVNDLYNDLLDEGFNTLAFHGDLEQNQREETLLQFKNQSYKILIATDVASRGIDIDDLGMVINYEMPYKHETYRHRIGRTGRADNAGLAVSLLSKKEAAFTDKQGEKFSTQVQMLKLESLRTKKSYNARAEYQTILLLKGKKEKLRAGDFVGALSGAGGFDSSIIGNIQVLPTKTYIAIKVDVLRDVMHFFSTKQVKKKKIKAILING